MRSVSHNLYILAYNLTMLVSTFHRLFQRKYHDICSIGFETNGRIYLFQRKSVIHGQLIVGHQSLFKNGYLYVIIPPKYVEIPSKLLQLENIKNIISKADGDNRVLNGFIVGGKGKFDKTLCVFSKNLDISEALENTDLFKFSYNNGKLTSAEITQEEKKLSGKTIPAVEEKTSYTLTSFEGSHPVFDSRNYRPVFSSFDQAARVLSEVRIYPFENIVKLFWRRFFVSEKRWATLIKIIGVLGIVHQF